MERDPDLRVLHRGAIERRLIDPHLAKGGIADARDFDHEPGLAVVVA